MIDLANALEDRWAPVTAEVAAVRAAIGPAVLLKVILETAVIGPARIEPACHAAEAGGADFVKTSTGFHPAGGASVEAVRAMAAVVGGRLGVKASGGIHTAESRWRWSRPVPPGSARRPPRKSWTGCARSPKRLREDDSHDQRRQRRQRAFNGVGVIRTKRDGGELTQSQIEDLMRAYLAGEFAEEQMSALLMAIFWRGMTAAESGALDGCDDRLRRQDRPVGLAAERGQALDRGRRRQDIADPGAAGRRVRRRRRQISGRGLGHTGGTLDKLESIHGWDADLDQAALVPGSIRSAASSSWPPRAGPGRPAALRAARHHRHRRVDPADRQLDHVQEGGRGHQEPAP